MKTLIISYQGGLFGEFLSSQISKSSPKFYNEHNPVVDESNRYWFPDYLAVANLSLRNYSIVMPRLEVSDEQLKILNDTYGDKHICVPTHWFNSLKLINLPAYGIRFKCQTETISNMSVALMWMKSHVLPLSLSPEVEAVFKRTIASGHVQSELLQKIVDSPGSYQNWKAMALLRFGISDLREYIKSSHRQNLFYNKSNYEQCPDWNIIDAGNIVYNDMADLPIIENLVEGTFDRSEIQAYAQKNLDLVKSKLGLNLDDFQGTAWLDTLYDWVMSLESAQQ
jgi:hypothetical protein